MIVAPPPSFSTSTPSPPSSPSPPSPPRMENLRRELTEAATLISRRVESNLGQSVHPAVLQALTEAVSDATADHIAIIEEAALIDLNSAPPSVDALINQCLDHNGGNPGLVNWIRELATHAEAVDHVIKLQGYLSARKGNLVRTEFQKFLVLILNYVGIRNEASVSLGAVCQKLKDKLQPYIGGSNLAMDMAARDVNRACYGVRDITNMYSHSTEAMSETHLAELWAFFKTLGVALPAIADEFYEPPPPPPSPPQGADMTASQVLEVLSTLLQTATEARQLQEMIDLLSPTTTAAASTTEAHTTVTTPTPGPTTPARGWEAIPSERTTSPVTSPLRPRGLHTPSLAALEDAAAYHFFYDRPEELPVETDGAPVTPMMFRRMLNHVERVSKASLCTLPVSHDPSCGRSHSYLEVMRYNPLYKLAVCRQLGHFWGANVAEDDQCVCIHVETGIDMRRVFSAKKTRCRHGDRCSDSLCIKAHSFEEVCWFNPLYRTKTCPFTPCLRPECSFAHTNEGERVRNFETEDDYVGKNVQMLFIERTHKPLADALEALRFVRSGAP